MSPAYRRILGSSCLVLLFAGVPASSQVIAPTDIEYKGAFRLPQGNYGGSTWAYGGWALTYFPSGDPNGSGDGYPGSLYGVGHDWDQLVAEISIPAPVISPGKNANDLPIATNLQPFNDITQGLINQGNPDKLGGLAYLPKQGAQTSDKLYWSVFEYYNANGNNNYNHGMAELNLSSPQAQGLWHLGPVGPSAFHSLKTGNYLFDIPESWSDAYVGGKRLGSGRNREAGAFGSSQGPALFAYGPWNDGNPPPNQSQLDATALLYYPEGGGHYPSYSACDDWDGGVWLTAGENSAVAFTGSKGLGATYYGDGRPQDCSSSKGYHCSPYEGQIVLYDPDELAAVAVGAQQPWDVVPYAVVRPDPYLFPDCRYRLGGTAFDRQRGFLYVIQKLADNAATGYPLVHVFQIHESPSSGNPTLSVTKAGLGSGSVTSAPAGINCGTDCQHDYDSGTIVTLTALPDTGSLFTGWSGHADCNDGTISMDGFRTCVATFLPEPGACIGGLSLDDWSTAPESLYLVGAVNVGEMVYTDRIYQFNAVSSGLAGTTLIQTANDDKYIANPNHLSFTLCQDSVVFVAYDKRASTLPSWLLDPGWTISGETLDTSHDLSDSIFSRTYAAGPLTLGGNQSGGAFGADSNYSILVKPLPPCSGPNQLTLENQTVSTSENFDACDTVTTGSDFVVQGPSGKVVISAGNAIIFGNGLSVNTGGELIAAVTNP